MVKYDSNPENLNILAKIFKILINEFIYYNQNNEFWMQLN
jgi:hypothetical protein